LGKSTPIGDWWIAGALEMEARRKAIRYALEISDGRLRPAAKALGVSHTTLSRWLAAEPALAEGVDLRKAGRPTKATP
jgi:transcriptional regulator of acetoin/glycerol metabolism